MRNEDFEAFVRILAKAGKWEILERLKGEKLSKNKGEVLNQSLKSAVS